MLGTGDLEEAKNRLEKTFGDRLGEVILYGSEARGEAGSDSDVDILVVLDEPVSYAEDLKRSVRALYPMTLRLGRPLTPRIATREEYSEQNCPLFRNARRQGVRL